MEETPKRDHILSNYQYDQLKKVVQLGLPALGTLYFALAEIWGLPRAKDVVGTIAAINVFLGVLLGFSSKSFHGSDAQYDGSIDIADSEEEAKKLFQLNLHGDPLDIETKKSITFKVNPPTQ